MAIIKNNTGHEIVLNYIYGPVSSRRYGITYGINLMPVGEKICTFNCVYCQLGWTTQRTPQKTSILPDQKDIIKELEFCLKNKTQKNISLVLSGNGEPTLHPHFSAMINEIIKLKNSFDKNIPIICFTNASNIHKKDILQSLNKLDECCVKADPCYNKTNLPPDDYSWLRIKKTVTHLNNLVIQSCLFEGEQSNTTTDCLNKWLEDIKGLTPKRVDLYTISRKTPQRGLEALNKERLEEIKDMVSKIVHCKITISI